MLGVREGKLVRVKVWESEDGVKVMGVTVFVGSVRVIVIKEGSMAAVKLIIIGLIVGSTFEGSLILD